MLWVPDAVAFAVLADIVGWGSEWVDPDTQLPIRGARTNAFSVGCCPRVVRRREFRAPRPLLSRLSCAAKIAEKALARARLTDPKAHSPVRMVAEDRLGGAANGMLISLACGFHGFLQESAMKSHRSPKGRPPQPVFPTHLQSPSRRKPRKAYRKPTLAKAAMLSAIAATIVPASGAG